MFYICVCFIKLFISTAQQNNALNVCCVFQSPSLQKVCEPTWTDLPTTTRLTSSAQHPLCSSFKALRWKPDTTQSVRAVSDGKCLIRYSILRTSLISSSNPWMGTSWTTTTINPALPAQYLLLRERYYAPYIIICHFWSTLAPGNSLEKINRKSFH